MKKLKKIKFLDIDLKIINIELLKIYERIES